MTTKKIPASFRVLIWLALSAPGALFALSTDHEQPIHIEADKLEIDESRHISTYTGQVHMRQGSLNIRGNQITMYFDADNNLQHMDITGQPARFDQLSDDNKPMSGTALEIHYRDSDGVMELKKQASLTSDQDLIESDFIRTNTRTNTLLAGDQEGKGRVRMLIQPRPKSTQ